MNNNALNDFYSQALDTLLWSESNDNGEPLDSEYSACDISHKTKDELFAECKTFLFADFPEDNDYLSGFELINALNIDYDFSRAGHDFILTRNGHGAGYWDRGLGSLGEELTERAKAYGPMHLYVGDDEEIHHHG